MKSLKNVFVFLFVFFCFATSASAGEYITKLSSGVLKNNFGKIIKFDVFSNGRKIASTYLCPYESTNEYKAYSGLSVGNEVDVSNNTNYTPHCR